jgi:hypothetical protein
MTVLYPCFLFQDLNWLTNFNETSYGRFAPADQSKLRVLCFAVSNNMTHMLTCEEGATKAAYDSVCHREEMYAKTFKMYAAFFKVFLYLFGDRAKFSSHVKFCLAIDHKRV